MAEDKTKPKKKWQPCVMCSGTGKLKPHGRTCDACGGGGGKWV